MFPYTYQPSLSAILCFVPVLGVAVILSIVLIRVKSKRVERVNGVMIEQDRPLLKWLNVASILWSVAGGLGICPAVLFSLIRAFDDTPLSRNRSGVVDDVLIYSVISLPLICIGTILGIWFLKKKYEKLAFYISLLPVFPLILIFAVFILANLSK